MSHVLADNVKESTITTGTGTLTLGGAVDGSQSFAVIGDGNTTDYGIRGRGTGEWETGIGTWTASGTTLARTTVKASSAGGTTHVDFSAGTKDVFCTNLAYSQQFLQAGTGAITRSYQDKAREIISVKDFGAIGDGTTHPLSERFATLGAAQVVYPHAIALTDEIDWAATQAAVNYAETIAGTSSLFTATGIGIGFPNGVYLFDLGVTVLADGLGFYGPPGKGAMIKTTATSQNIFTVGDPAYLERLYWAEFLNLIFIATDTTATGTTAIRLNRTVNVRISNCIAFDFNIAVDSYGSSTTSFDNFYASITGRNTVAAIASIRHQGVDLTGSGITYSPGGGMRITDSEFLGNSLHTEMMPAHLLIHAVDGLYVSASHFGYAVNAVQINPLGTLANNTITDVFFDSKCYFDDPHDTNGRNVSIIGTVNYLSASSPGIYQNIHFDGSFFRGAENADYNVIISVQANAAFTTNSRKVRNITFSDCTLSQSRLTSVIISGTASSRVEVYDVSINHCYINDHNVAGTASYSGISAECESLSVTDCTFKADRIAAASNVVFNASLAASGAPSLLLRNNDFSDSNCTDDTVTFTNVAGLICNVGDNTYQGKGHEINQLFKLTTSSAAPAVIWSRVLDAGGQVGMVKTRCIGANSDASERARYEHTASFFRQSGGSAAATTVTVSAAELITGSNAPVVLDLLTGTAFQASHAYAAGDLLTNAGNVYLVMIAGTSSSTAPTFTSGTATNGTCTIGYVSATAANTLALIVSGTAATSINWAADVEFMAVP